MNPFGIFSVLQAALDAMGATFGRKPKQDRRREQLWTNVMALLLVVLGLIAMGFAIYQIYF